MKEHRAAWEDETTLAVEALEQSPLVLTIYDARLRIRRMAAGARRLFGLGERDLRGKRLTDALPGDPVAKKCVRHMRRVVETGGEVHTSRRRAGRGR